MYFCLMKRPIQIIYEDDYLLAVNKPPRVASVPAKEIMLQQTVLGKIQRLFENQTWKPYLLHRLDYQTSGVLLFGKQERNRVSLTGILRHQETRKKYAALVKGIPEGRIITKPLQARGSVEKIPARTDYKILKVFRLPGFICSLVNIEMRTGRKHQIRKHFSLIGHPVVLDATYGDFRFNRKFRMTFRLGRQFLHCSEVSFLHPMTNALTKIIAPIPPDLKVVLKRLGI